MAYKGIALPSDYTFDASAKTVTFGAAYTGIELGDIMLILNVTDGITIFKANSPTQNGTLVGLVLTLTYDTTAMADSDELQVIVGAGFLATLVTAASLPLPAGAATQATLAAILAKLIAAPATEAKQDVGNISLFTLAGVDFATQATLAAIQALLPAALVGGRLSVNVGARVAATPTKTQGTSVISLQSVAASTVLISSAVDVSTKFQASLFIRFGRRAATAAGAGANIRVEGSYKSSGDNSWIPLAIFTTSFAAVESEAASGAVAAGQKVITVASTTNLTAGDIIFIDNPTIGNSEWARIKSISAGVSVTVEDDLVNAATGATIYDNAEMFVCQLDLSSIGRIRVVDDGSVFTQAHAIQVDMVTLDSLV